MPLLLALFLLLVSPSPAFAARYVPPIRIDDAHQGVSDMTPEHPDITAKDAYPNNIKQEKTFTCTFPLSITETFEPQEVGYTDANGVNQTTFEPYEVEEVQNNVTLSDRANDSDLNAGQHFGKRNVQTNYRSTMRSFYSMGNSSVGSAPKMISAYNNEECLLRSQNLDKIILTLTGSSSDTQDLGLANNCDGRLQKLNSSLDCPVVTIAEVYYGMLVRGKQPPYCRLQGDRIIRFAKLPDTIVNPLKEYFTGNPTISYLNRFGREFSALSLANYELLYGQIPIIAGESIGLAVRVYNRNKLTEEYTLNEEKIVGFNSVGAVATGRYGTTVQYGIPSNQQLVDAGDPCQSEQSDPVQDHPEPLTVFQVIVNGFVRLVEDNPLSITEPTKGEIDYPVAYKDNIQKDLTFQYGFISAAEQKKKNFQAEPPASHTSTDTRQNPNNRNLLVRDYIRDGLTPASWHPL